MPTAPFTERVKDGLGQALRPLPASLLMRCCHSAALRRFGRLGLRNRDGVIAAGSGAGLRFNPGRANPDYLLGHNEPPVQQVLAEQLKAGDVFHDIGANVGFFSVIAARLVGPTGQVWAFEPEPANAAVLRRNIALNGLGNVHLRQQAVSDHGGSGHLQLAVYAGGHALDSAPPPPDSRGTLPVELVSIDELLADGLVTAPTLVKIDVEGGEQAVLAGMAGTLARHRPLVVYEIDAERTEQLTTRQAEVADFLAGLGYRVRALAPSYAGGAWRVGHALAVPVEKVRP